MDDAVLRTGDQELELPVHGGTEGDGAIDISKLRGATGLVTLDRGFGNTAEGTSDVTFINGEEGILRYRGYPIEQLAEQTSFLEVSYLLQYGELPTAAELDHYEERIRYHTMLREDMKHLFEAFPHKAHPMQILASATSALATYYPDALDPLDKEAVDISARRLVAKTPTMIAWSYKYSVHQPYVYPDNSLDYTTNFLKMMFSVPAEEYEPDPVVTKALNMLLILHADHGQNCSSSAVPSRGIRARQTSSPRSRQGSTPCLGPFMVAPTKRFSRCSTTSLPRADDLDTGVKRAKDKDDPFRLMGFGTPRLQELRSEGPHHQEGCRKRCSTRSESTIRYWIWRCSSRMWPCETTTSWSESSIRTSDFYSGIIYRAMGFPTEMFTVLFALGRLPGWLAQWRELAADPQARIFRPRQLYTGPAQRDLPAIDQR